QSSRNEVAAAILMFTVTATIAVAAVPHWGGIGAACAVIAGQLAACGVFLWARPRMPVPADVLGIIAIAAAAFAISTALDQLELSSRVTKIVAKLCVVGGSGLFVVWRFNLLGIMDFLRTVKRRHLSCENIDATARAADHSPPRSRWS